MVEVKAKKAPKEPKELQPSPSPKAAKSPLPEQARRQEAHVHMSFFAKAA